MLNRGYRMQDRQQDGRMQEYKAAGCRNQTYPSQPRGPRGAGGYIYIYMDLRHVFPNLTIQYVVILGYVLDNVVFTVGA